MKYSQEYIDYTQNVNPDLVKYVEDFIFPEYAKNDKGHGIVHILEVVRRSFELKRTMHLDTLDDNIIYAVAVNHDNGKYIDNEIHEKIAGDIFMKNFEFKKYFIDQQRRIIKEAIEDHRSSLQNQPRSDYGKLISSADRNSSIDMVFIRSFFVGQERTPHLTVREFLDYTLNRLRERYSIYHSENMFYVDNIYSNFLVEMRNLLQNKQEFERRYCAINRLTDPNKKLIEEVGYTY